MSRHAHHSHGEHAHATVSEEDKLAKVIEHWIHHNHEHARSYRDWAERARQLEHEEIAVLLEQVADETTRQNQTMERALALLKRD